MLCSHTLLLITNEDATVLDICCAIVAWLNSVTISGEEIGSVSLLWSLLKFQVCVFAAGSLSPLRPPFEMEIFLGNQNMPHAHTVDLSACHGSLAALCAPMAADTCIRNTMRTAVAHRDPQVIKISLYCLLNVCYWLWLFMFKLLIFVFNNKNKNFIYLFI